MRPLSLLRRVIRSVNNPCGVVKRDLQWEDAPAPIAPSRPKDKVPSSQPSELKKILSTARPERARGGSQRPFQALVRGALSL